jgi:hypothetical protein
VLPLLLLLLLLGARLLLPHLQLHNAPTQLTHV